ncbi:MAG: PolC-type DNA polymerase III [Lachnospirales bacterium]
MENCKSFIEVFNKDEYEFSMDIENSVRDIMVYKLTHYKEESLFKISAFSNNFLNEHKIHKAIEKISNHYDQNVKFEMDLIYKYNGSFKDTIVDFFEHYKKHLYEVSPVCSKILGNSRILVDEERNIIKLLLKKENIDMLSYRKIDEDLSNIISKRFSENYIVKFEENKVDKKDKSNHKNSKRSSWNTKRLEAGVSTVKVTEKVEKKKVTYNKGPMKQIKVKEDLEVTGTIESSIIENEEIVIRGVVGNVEDRDLRSGKKLVIFDVYDDRSAVTMKIFATPVFFEDNLKKILKKGNGIIAGGKVVYDTYADELSVMCSEVTKASVLRDAKFDDRANKRIELHCHSNMSKMDAIPSVSELINRAKDYGHSAIAITDHGVVQGFPDMSSAAANAGIKVLYGVEAYVIDDKDTIVKYRDNINLEGEFVVFDVETTGFSNRSCKIIEIGAVKVKGGEIIGEFSEFINPNEPLSDEIKKLTNISDNDLKDKDTIDVILPKFIEFIGDATLVAHNASFDVGFINKNCKDICKKDLENPYIDTVALSWAFIKDVKNYKLNTIVEYFGITLDNHHRAIYDAIATNEVFQKLFEMVKEVGIKDLKSLNEFGLENIEKKRLRSSHGIIFAKNLEGLRNLYILISKSHIDYFYRQPRMPKSVIDEYKNGLILGTACEAGELYKSVYNNLPYFNTKNVMDYYDYFEVQPLGNNQFLIDKNDCTLEDLVEVNVSIINLGEVENKLVVATGDVHFLNASDNVYRSIILEAEKFKDADKYIPLYYRNTEEMLKEFDYLSDEKALEIVVTNTNKISDMIEDILPVPKGTFPPLMPKADEELTEIVYAKAHKLYGNPLPDIVLKRIERELGSIIKNGFSVMYIIAQKLVWKSLEDGYLVGSRGSVGSSFVATMSDITEVNPLQPHYYCKNCQYTDFDSDTVKTYLGTSGCDMPDKKCPNCNEDLCKEGHDIPFETFLGFDGDKEPDIDLNFSGEYQSHAHDYTEELFGKGFVFKAGTISTLADKTAYAYVASYYENKGLRLRNAEINRVRDKLIGIRKSSGQHPGGLMVVPSDNSIYNFCPIQRPANDMKSDVVTTHFDYHSISGRLLKLDILGHDVPTILRHLEDITGVDPTTIDVGDKKIMELFVSPDLMGINLDEIGCETGSLGLPEFGTSFVRKMLLDTMPSTFSELVRISGLSHGTNVWLGNAQDLVQDGVATLKEIIPTRDDIMVYLILQGVEELTAFKIMEGVRKGKGLSEEQEQVMIDNNVPDWYIDSCKKIKYMFPKGHAVAYVMMTVRIAFYKLYYPEAFYVATLSEKYSDIDYETMCQDKDDILALLKELNALSKPSQTEKNKITVLELIYEMYERGIEFSKVDIYKAKPTKFLIDDRKIMPPLCTIAGLGENAGIALAKERENGEFETIDDFRKRTKITKTVIQIMKDLDVLKGIPETNQVSLFEM